MKNFNINLNKRICIQQEVLTSDGCGGYNSTWNNVINLWASFDSYSANQISTYFKNDVKITHVIEIRYNPNVKIGNKILFENREFLIKECTDPDESKISMLLAAEELQAS